MMMDAGHRPRGRSAAGRGKAGCRSTRSMERQGGEDAWRRKGAIQNRLGEITWKPIGGGAGRGRVDEDAEGSYNRRGQSSTTGTTPAPPHTLLPHPHPQSLNQAASTSGRRCRAAGASRRPGTEARLREAPQVHWQPARGPGGGGGVPSMPRNLPLGHHVENHFGHPTSRSYIREGAQRSVAWAG